MIELVKSSLKSSSREISWKFRTSVLCTKIQNLSKFHYFPARPIIHTTKENHFFLSFNCNPTMIPRVPGSRRLSSMRVLSTADRTIQTFPPEHSSDIIQRRGGLIAVPARSLTFSSPRFPVANDGKCQRLTKLLLNVNIESSLGPVHVIVSSDNTVKDLIKAAIEIYVKEKRRPLLEETDPKLFQLHYSQFSLESLKAGEKVINLGSRNFFLCLKQRPSSPGKAKLALDPLFSLTKLGELLL